VATIGRDKADRGVQRSTGLSCYVDVAQTAPWRPTGAEQGVDFQSLAQAMLACPVVLLSATFPSGEGARFLEVTIRRRELDGALDGRPPRCCIGGDGRECRSTG